MPLQTKLDVSQPGDPLEQEADRIADHVMGLTGEEAHLQRGTPGNMSLLQRKCAECEEEENEKEKDDEKDKTQEGDKVQRKEVVPQPAFAAPRLARAAIESGGQSQDLAVRAFSAGVDQVGPALSRRSGAEDHLQRMCAACEEDEEEQEQKSGDVQRMEAGSAAALPRVDSREVSAVVGSGGAPLEASMRGFMEPRFGHDFSRVRVHADSRSVASAQALQARAYTIGDHIVLGKDASSAGLTQRLPLLAHELAHVIQQGAANPKDASPISDSGVARSVIMRDGDAGAAPAPDDKLDAKQYTEKFSKEIQLEVLSQMSQVPVVMPSTYATWLNESEFVKVAMSPLSAPAGLWTALTGLLSQQSPDAAINRGRDAGADGKGVPTFNKNVGLELRNAITPKLTDSLNRIMPRYLEARNQALFKEEASATVPPDKAPEPNPADIIPSHPFDKSVTSALCQGTVQANFATYRKENPSEAKQHALRTIREVKGVTFELEQLRSPMAGFNWLRVAEPADATAPEVANEIYGDAGKANLITPAAPLFGFQPEGLKPDYQARWNKATAAAGRTSDPNGITDPAKQILAGPDADAAAQNQAKARGSTGASGDEIVQRMRLSLTQVDEIKEKLAKSRLFADYASLLEPVRTRIDERSKRVNSADASQTSSWDGQSAGQLRILQQAATGVDIACKSADAFSGQSAPADPGVRQQLDQIRAPVRNLAVAYVDAALVSDLVETAQVRLTAANERVKTLGLDLADSLLAYIRGVLDGAKTNAKIDPKRLADLEKRGQEIRERVMKARDLVNTNPSGLSAEIQSINTEIDHLRMESTLVANMDACHAAAQDLNAALGQNPALPGIAQTAQDYINAKNDLRVWYDNWNTIYEAWSADDVVKKGWAEGKFLELSTKPEWQQKFLNIRKMIQDDKVVEKWVGLGVMIGIAAVSAAAGAIVGAGLIGAVVEAGTFTAMSTALLNQNPTIGGVIVDFGLNLAMLGGMKAYSAAFKGVVGAQFAGTVIGQGVQFTGVIVGIAATRLAAADSKKRASTGDGISSAEAEEIVFDTVAETIGLALGGRLGEGLLNESPVRNATRFKSEFEAIDVADQSALKKAQALEALARSQAEAAARGEPAKAGADVMKQARELLSEERKGLDQKQKLLDKIRDAILKGEKVEGLTLADVEALKAGVGKKIDANKLASVMLELKPVGAERFLCSEGRLEPLSKTLTELGYLEKGRVTDEVNNATTVEFSDPTGADTMKITEARGNADAVNAKPGDSPYIAIEGRTPIEAGGESHRIKFGVEDGKVVIRICTTCRQLKIQIDRALGDTALTSEPGVKGKLEALRNKALQGEKDLNSKRISDTEAQTLADEISSQLNELATQNPKLASLTAAVNQLKAFEELARKYHLTDQQVTVLSENNAASETVDKLMTSGITADLIVKLVERGGGKSLEIADALLDRGLPAEKARSTAFRAADTKMVDDILILAKSPNFKKPETLIDVLNLLSKGSQGFRLAIHDAAQRSATNEVELETGQADLIDNTAKEALQHKRVEGDKETSVYANLNKAAQQLRGDRKEVPPAGYKTVAMIEIVNDKNPLYDADRARLSAGIKTTTGLHGVTQIIIINNKGRFEFDGPLFD